MKTSKNYARLTSAMSQEDLLGKLEALKWLIRIGVVASIIWALAICIDAVLVYNRSNDFANLNVNLVNEKYAESLDADNYITVNDQLSIQLAVRRVGEAEWHPRAIVAGWHEEVEVRVLAKVVLPTGDESYNHPINLSTSKGLTDMRWSEGVTIIETHESEKVIYVYETIFCGRVTAKDWWEGYTPIAIRYLSDDLAEKLVTVYVIPDFGYISRPEVFVPLGVFAIMLLITISGVISRHKTFHELHLLE